MTLLDTFCHVATLNTNNMILSGDKCHKKEVVECICFPPLWWYEADHGKTLTKVNRSSELIRCSTFLRDHVPSSTQHPILLHVSWLLCDLLRARGNVSAITAASYCPLVDRRGNPVKSKLSEQIKNEMFLILRMLVSVLPGFLIENVICEEKPVLKM